MKNSTRQALPIVASVIGERLGIPVVVGGQQAWTNGKVIIIPNVESEEHKGVAFGYLIHEGAHIRYSDFTLRGSTPYTQSIVNILEDIRIEQAIAREYPGAPARIREVIDHLVEAGNISVSNDKPHEILYKHVLLRLRARILKQERLDDLAMEQEKILRARLPEGIVVRLHGILASAEKNSSTADCIAMAERIVAMLKDEVEKEKQSQQDEKAPEPSSDAPQTKPSEGADKDGSNNSREDTAADTEGADEDGQQSGSDPADDTGEDGGHDGDPTDGTEASGEDEPQGEPQAAEGSGEDGGNGNNDNTPPPSQASSSGASSSQRSEDLMEAVEAIVSNQDEAPEDLFQQVAAILGAAVTDGSFSLPQEHKAEMSVDTALLQKVGSESSRIAAALSGFVQSERQERRTHKYQGRKIDTGKLHRVASGDTRIFLRDQRREAVNTALHVLLDMSSSMSLDNRAKVAKEAAMALALALDRIPGVNQSLTVFPGPDVVTNGVRIPGVLQLLAPREHPRRLSGPLAQCHANGGTPMTEALYYAASRLVGGQEHRKTIMVITDGEPNDPASTKKAVTEIRQMGIETCGIGIGTMIVHDLFPEHAVIGSVQQLRDALFAMARRILALRAA